MNLGTSRLSISGGNGFVARQGSIVLLVEPSAGGHEAVVDELFELTSDGSAEALALVRRIGAVVTGHPAEEVPTFGALVQVDADVVAVLSGDVSLTVARGADEQVIDAIDVSTYVEWRLRGQADRLWLAVTGAAPADPRSSLSSGVVRGSGVLLVPGTSPARPAREPGDEAPTLAGPAAAPAPEPGSGALSEPVDEPVFESIDLFEERASQPDAQVEPPVEEPPTLVSATMARPPVPTVDDRADEPTHLPGAEAMPAPMVEGIYCSRGHFNNPRQIFCTQCGISMVQQTHNRVRGPRPPLGVLVTDQGAVFSLARDFVVGREPETAAEVVNGTALPLALDDPELALSRVHARIVLDGWEVRVEDASSANGTFVSVEGGEWKRLEPGRPTTVEPGSTIALGNRVLSFETHQRS